MKTNYHITCADDFTRQCPDCEWRGTPCKEHQEKETDEAIIARTYFSGVQPFNNYQALGKIIQSLKIRK